MARIYGSQIGGGLGAGAAAAIGSAALGPVGMMALPMLGSIFGGLFDQGADVDAIVQEMINQYSGIVPPDLAKAIVYTQFEQGGRLTPEQLSKLPEEAQKVVLLQENPEMRQKQMAQMQAMERLAATGMGPEERFALEQSRMKAAQDAQARLKGLQQQYAQMGQAGGQAAFAAQLGTLQQTAQDEAMANMQAAAMAAANRRAAIQQAASMAGQLRAQDLGVEQANVEARRQRQIFDIQNAMSRQQYNAQMAQQANMMNLQRQQQIQDMNIKMANEEAYRQGYLAPQQMYANQMQLAQARANALGTKAGLAQQQNQAAAAAMGGAITGFGQLGLGMSQMSQANDYMNMMGAANNLTKNAAGEWVRNTAAQAAPALIGNPFAAARAPASQPIMPQPMQYRTGVTPFIGPPVAAPSLMQNAYGPAVPPGMPRSYFYSQQDQRYGIPYMNNLSYSYPMMFD